MRLRKFIGGVIAVGFIVAGVTVGAARAQKLMVGYSGISADLSHLWIAHEAGLFKKHAVEVVPIYFSGGNRLMQALVANDIQIGITSGISSARAIVAGADITIVAGHINKLTYTLYTNKEITKAEQLKGKRMAISGFGTTSHASTVIAPKKLGVNPKEVTLFQIGDQASRFAALQANTIQGILIAPPLTTLAKNRGFNPLIDLTQAALPRGGARRGAMPGLYDLDLLRAGTVHQLAQAQLRSGALSDRQQTRYAAERHPNVQ
jgi:NitT/TauT family transport system substrate-binding protein